MRFVPHATPFLIVAAICLCSAAPAVLAQEGKPVTELRYASSLPQKSTSSAEQLKAIFLDCDRQASAGLVDMGVAAYCSLAYEELKRTVFDGDFNRLMAWWRAHRVAVTSSSR